MVTRMSDLAQTAKSVITFMLILGTLSMIWPAIIALGMGASSLLLRSWSSGEVVVTVLSQLR